MHSTLRVVLFTPLLGIAAVALAVDENVKELTDGGAELSHDPYDFHHRPDFTQGRIAGFLKLYGEADALAGALKPAVPPETIAPEPEPEPEPAPAPEEGEDDEAEGDEAEGDEVEGTDGDAEPAPAPAPAPVPATPAKGTLQVNNPTSAWAEVSINGTKIGTIAVFGNGRIHQVTNGGYDIEYKLPNGYVWKERVFVTTEDNG